MKNIVFTRDSYLKQNPNKSVDPTRDLETGSAIKTMENAKVRVSAFSDVDSTEHREIKCTSPIGGITTWYVFYLDILIDDVSGAPTTNLNIVFTRDSYLKQNPNKPATPANVTSGNAILMAQGAPILVTGFGEIDPANKHRKIKLATNPITDIVTWYVYAPDVAIAP